MYNEVDTVHAVSFLILRVDHHKSGENLQGRGHRVLYLLLDIRQRMMIECMAIRAHNALSINLLGPMLLAKACSRVGHKGLHCVARPSSETIRDLHQI